jgi:hypothetical protein
MKKCRDSEKSDEDNCRDLARVVMVEKEFRSRNETLNQECHAEVSNTKWLQ